MEQPARGEPLLQTKLFAPVLRGDAVPRPHLVEKLSAGLFENGVYSRKLTLFSAPAGYGKTTLASQWVNDVGIPVAWLLLEASENDAIRFLSYLIAAVQIVAPQTGHVTQAMLRAPQRPQHDVLLTPLINELASLEQPVLVVLDDYHVIQSQSVHELLNYFLEHMPSNVHLVLTSREDPPLPLHRMQARQQMLGIRQSELSFSVAEVERFFNQTSGVKLTGEQAARLTRRTEGWITGLQLAALSMSSAPDRQAFIDSFTGSNRFILDYLFEEVFILQPDRVKSFLLQTAILDRLCADLAEAVTGSPGAQSLLEELERANFFIIPLDQNRWWYRYHRLFGDLLRHRLGQSGIDIRALHERAGNWYAERGLFEEAIEHGLLGEHWSMASGWIAAEGDACLRRGEIFTLLNWWRRVPEATILQRPDWALSYAWGLILAGEMEPAVQLLDRARHIPGAESNTIAGEIAAAEAYVSRARGDVDQTIELSRRALELLPEEDIAARGTVALNLGLTTWHVGRLDEAQAALELAFDHTSASSNTFGAQTALLFLARTLGAQAQFNAALEYYKQALDLGEKVPTAALVLTDLAAIDFDRGRTNSAWEYLERAKTIVHATNSTEFLSACAVQEALFHMQYRQFERARSALEPAFSCLEAHEVAPTTQARILACLAQIEINLGELSHAQQTLQQIRFPHDAQTFYRFIDLNTARLLLARGERKQARHALESARARAAAGGWRCALEATSLLQALAAESIEQALEHLRPVVLDLEDEGCVRFFLNEGDQMIPLLREAARHGVAPDFIGRILAAAERSARPGQPADVDLIEPLTGREIEVVRLLAAGLSNRQIAEQLVISLGTAKAHVHHIFGKLGVSSRTQAATRAHELGLLQNPHP